jgi:hypothetical protein
MNYTEKINKITEAINHCHKVDREDAGAGYLFMAKFRHDAKAQQFVRVKAADAEIIADLIMDLFDDHPACESMVIERLKQERKI